MVVGVGVLVGGRGRYAGAGGVGLVSVVPQGGHRARVLPSPPQARSTPPAQPRTLEQGRSMLMSIHCCRGESRLRRGRGAF